MRNVRPQLNATKKKKLIRTQCLDGYYFLFATIVCDVHVANVTEAFKKRPHII